MDTLRIVSLLIAASWTVAAISAARWRLARVAALCVLLAAAHVAAGAWPAAAPLAVAAWLGYGLAVPTGRLGSAARIGLAAVGTAGGGAWTAALVARGQDAPAGTTLAGAGAAVAVVGATGMALRCRRATPRDRATCQWLAAAGVVAVALDIVLLALHVLIGVRAGLAGRVAAVRPPRPRPGGVAGDLPRGGGGAHRVDRRGRDGRDGRVRLPRRGRGPEPRSGRR